MMDENNADRAYDKFHNHFQHLCNEAMPIKNKKIKLIIYIQTMDNSQYPKFSLLKKQHYKFFFKPKLLSPSKNILTIKIY